MEIWKYGFGDLILEYGPMFFGFSQIDSVLFWLFEMVDLKGPFCGEYSSSLTVRIMRAC